MNARKGTLTKEDAPRMAKQLASVRAYVLMQQWVTLRRISDYCSCSEASASARLRDLRKIGFLVERRRVAEGNGLHEYRVTKIAPKEPEQLSFLEARA